MWPVQISCGSPSTLLSRHSRVAESGSEAKVERRGVLALLMYNSHRRSLSYRPAFVTLFLETLRDGAPVDDIPNGTKVLGLAVLVLQIVCVLPGVYSKERLEVAGDGVLVGAGDEAEGAGGLVLDEPGPAGALDSGEGGVGLLLEVLEGAKVLVDGSLRKVSGDSQRACCGGGYLCRERRSRTRSSPWGSPPPPLPWGARFSQKREWLTWPPPWKLSRGAWAAAALVSPLAWASAMASEAALKLLT